MKLGLFAILKGSVKAALNFGCQVFGFGFGFLAGGLFFFGFSSTCRLGGVFAFGFLGSSATLLL